MEQASSHTQKARLLLRKPSKKLLLGGGIIILFLILICLILAFNRPHQAITLPGEKLPQEAKAVIDELNQKMELPQGETPTMATVTDVSKLDTQPFFKNAKDGDTIIIYATAKKAILYRRSTHKIIDVAPININEDIKNLQKGQ